MIEPDKGEVVAPFDGVVTALFPTKHAIGLTGEDGTELLIHVGINTVELNGKYFESFVNQGDKVKKGQKLVTFDLNAIEKEGYLTQTMIIVTNTEDVKSVEVIENPDISNKNDFNLRSGRIKTSLIFSNETMIRNLLLDL